MNSRFSSNPFLTNRAHRVGPKTVSGFVVVLFESPAASPENTGGKLHGNDRSNARNEPLRSGHELSSVGIKIQSEYGCERNDVDRKKQARVLNSQAATTIRTADRKGQHRLEYRRRRYRAVAIGNNAI